MNIVGWTAKELRELGLPLYRYRACSCCHRYIDNRNHRRHFRACLKAMRAEREKGTK